jgi:flagellar protein FlbT
MTGGLVLRLRPHEKFLVNGVVIENGARRARLRVKTQDANILRIREALHPDNANTPARRLYYIAQLGVVGETDSEETKSALIAGLEDLQQAFGEHVCREDIEAALQHARAGEFYRAMRALNRILPHEAALLSTPALVEAQRPTAARL